MHRRSRYASGMRSLLILCLLPVVSGLQSSLNRLVHSARLDAAFHSLSTLTPPEDTKILHVMAGMQDINCARNLVQHVHKQCGALAAQNVAEIRTVKDTWVKKQVEKGVHEGYDDIVYVHAALCTHAFTLPFLSNCDVTEVDMASVIDLKETLLRDYAFNMAVKCRSVRRVEYQEWLETPSFKTRPKLFVVYNMHLISTSDKELLLQHIHEDDRLVCYDPCHIPLSDSEWSIERTSLLDIGKGILFPDFFTLGELISAKRLL